MFAERSQRRPSWLGRCQTSRIPQHLRTKGGMSALDAVLCGCSGCSPCKTANDASRPSRRPVAVAGESPNLTAAHAKPHRSLGGHLSLPPRNPFHRRRPRASWLDLHQCECQRSRWRLLVMAQPARILYASHGLARRPGRKPHPGSLARPCFGARCSAGPTDSGGRDVPGRLKRGPASPAPLYDDSGSLTTVLMGLFRRKMEAELGEEPSSSSGYAAIVDLSRRLSIKYPTPLALQDATHRILASLFPKWLPGAFAALFSRPLPRFSARLNAYVTAVTCSWLMGPCAVTDLPSPDAGVAQGVLVERCRYLEETGCASICLNSCKLPTQAFFADDMGLPLTMTPNLEDFSCQFSFGRAPVPEEERAAAATGCLANCPTARAQAELCYKMPRMEKGELIRGSS